MIDAQEDNIPKNLHVQQVIVGILHRVKEGQQCSKKMDWMDICILADYSGDINSNDCSDWWGEKETNISMEREL